MYKKILSVFLIAVFSFTFSLPVFAEGEKEIFSKEEMNLTDGFLDMFEEMPIVKNVMLKVIYAILFITFFVALVTTLSRIFQVVKGQSEEGSIMYIAKPMLWWFAMFFILVAVNAMFKIMSSLS